jgi:hypothetical protein
MRHVERHVDMPLHTIQHAKRMNVCGRITTLEDSDFKPVILTRIKKLPDDDHLMIETCWSDFKCFGV